VNPAALLDGRVSPAHVLSCGENDPTGLAVNLLDEIADDVSFHSFRSMMMMMMMMMMKRPPPSDFLALSNPF